MDNLLKKLFMPVRSLPKIGEKIAEHLARLDIQNVKDLLFHLPREIQIKTINPDFKRLEDGVYIVTEVKISEVLAPKARPGRKQIAKIHCYNDSGHITLVYYNFFPHYLFDKLDNDREIVIEGRVSRDLGFLAMKHPDKVTPGKLENSRHAKYEPIYPLTYALSNNQLKLYVSHAFSYLPMLPEWQDEKTLSRVSNISFDDALKLMHFPKANDNSLNLRRLAYDEILASQIALARIRAKTQKQVGIIIPAKPKLFHDFLTLLPFELTQDQKNVVEEIASDMGSAGKMNRLVLGDVGSGKTAVALCACLNVIAAGYQTAIMAPTDILARQHYHWFAPYAEKLGLTCALLTGKTASKERAGILSALENSSIQLIFGTHSLFQDTINFAKLGLVVIDEQHRFGVLQRAKMADKGINVHMLMLSATPIPRSMLMTFYGDLEHSKILHKPADRLPIITSTAAIKRLDEVAEAVLKNIEAGKKIYWICPLIEDREVDDETYGQDLAAAEIRFEYFNKLLPGKVGMIHGRIKSDERNITMEEFAKGELRLLVATTVIEVGIDVKDASIIIIEQAERFGLAQLHQLRGRVGRGNIQSYCILLYGNRLSQVGKDRMAIMKNEQDGFKIAEEDLRLRGGGDILGTKQSGLPEFKFANPYDHLPYFEYATNLAKNLMAVDPELAKPENYKYRVLLELFGYWN